jgi:hypothetical protein
MGPAEIIPFLQAGVKRAISELLLLKMPCWYCPGAQQLKKKNGQPASWHTSHSASTPSNSHLDFFIEQFCSISIYYTFNCLLIGAAVFSVFEACCNYPPQNPFQAHFLL